MQNLFSNTEINIEGEESIYKNLLYDNSNLFFVASVAQIAASITTGFISPSDNENWSEKVRLYPESILTKVAKDALDKQIFVLVPLIWAKYGTLTNEKKTYYYEIPLNSILPINDIIAFYINQKSLETIQALSATFQIDLDYQYVENYTLTEKQELKQFNTSAPEFVNRVMGGVLGSAICEIYGILIDEKTIKRSSTHIEPFKPYKLLLENGFVNPKQIIHGNHAYNLILSLEHNNVNDAILDFNMQEAKLKEQVFNKTPNASKIQDYAIMPEKQFIWLIPLILKHSTELEKGNALDFLKELKKILTKNKIKNSVENLWAYILFAGFSAYFLSGNIWGNENEGIDTSFSLIKKLKTSVSKLLFKGNVDLTKGNAHKILIQFAEIAKSTKSSAKTGSTKGITKLVEKYEKAIGKGNLFETIVGALLITWSTGTISKDWYNLLNVPFNRDVNNLSQLYPILGAWAGFIHGYKALRRKRKYPFINAVHLEKLAINAAKKIENPKLKITTERTPYAYIDNFELISNSSVLKLLCTPSGFKCPLTIPIKSTDSNLLEEKELELEGLKKLIRDFKDAENLQNEIKNKLFKST